MKTFPTVLTPLLTIVLVLVLFSVGLPHAPALATPVASASTVSGQADTSAQPGCDASRSVQVSGTAVLNVSPDRAMIQLGVQSNGSSVKAVEEVNSAATLAVIKAVRAVGIESKDIATDRYGIEPIYENYDSLYIKGYRIHNVVAVTLRDVSKTSLVISAALQAGANQVVNVDFYTSDLRKYRDQAREMAMKAAQEKAQALAAAAGTEAGCVLSIQENSWSNYNGWWYGRTQNQWTQNVMQNIAPSGSSTAEDEPISLGQISVKAEISASFGLK